MKYFIKRNKLRLASLAFAAAAALTHAVAADHGPQPPAIRARDVFESIQSPALETLRHSTRLDMLDYWDADSIFKAPNEMKGESWFINVTPDYLKVQVSPVSTYEIKILPLKKGNMVMTVYTVGTDTQARDSRIEFFDSSLAPLDGSKYFKAPQLKDFFEFPKGEASRMKEIEEIIPFTTVEYSLSPDNDTITARLTSPTFLSDESRKAVLPYLKPELKLNLKGT